MSTEAKQKIDNKAQNDEQNTDERNDNQTINQTGEVILEQVKDKASNMIDEQKANLTSGLSSVADSIRKVGENLRDSEEENRIGQMTAQYSDQLAKGIEKVTNYFETSDLRDISSDVQTFARRQPALFIGGAFVLGLLAARFLKTSTTHEGGLRRSNKRINQSHNSETLNNSEGVHPV